LHNVLASLTYLMSVIRSNPVVDCCLDGTVAGGLRENFLSCTEMGICAPMLKVALASASIESL